MFDLFLTIELLTFTAFVSPLCLPLGSYLNKKTGLVAGWGVSTLGLLHFVIYCCFHLLTRFWNFIKGGATASPMLQYLQLPIVDTRSCADSYARFSANSRTPIIINESQLCAQGTANRDACQGIYYFEIILFFPLQN